ncbi:MAG: DUF1667 domain-containing protein, partial [Lachnospiraceae bacterium]|nr:DUF1667 domain-containing protein [Lachnospiraceae bacterium]
MEERLLTCINCPMGCQITVTMEDGQVLSVEGNTCPRGDSYARKEVTNPTRIVTSSVYVNGAESGAKTVSVKTQNDIPKGKIFEVLEELKGLTVEAPV